MAFPELALTTFFPRTGWFDHQADIDALFETEMPGPATKPLFDEAAIWASGSRSASPS